MKKIIKLVLPALLLCVCIVLSVCMPSFNKPINTDSVEMYADPNVAGSTVAATMLNNVATQNADPQYAFGATVSIGKDGNKEFKFVYDGKEYKNAYEYVLARDGFLYGYDWDWFGPPTNQNSVLGDDHINGAKSRYRPAYVTRAQYNMRALGRNAMATWIGPKGCFTFDHDTGYVTGLDDKFKVNLVYLLESCRETETVLVPCLLTQWFGDSYYQDSAYNKLAEEQKEFYFRFYYDEAARKEWLEHGVAEICKILVDYQDVIAAVALSIENGSITNDIQTGMLYGNNAYTWKDFASMQNAMHDKVKEYMPNVYTSVEDNGGWYDNMYKYNDLKVDLICPQQYSPSGGFLDQETYIKTRNGYLGEFNYHYDNDPYNTVTIEYIDSIMLKHFVSLRKAGLAGGFHFCVSQQYEEDRWSYYMSSNMDEYQTLRNYAIPLSYIIHDLKEEHKAGVKDSKISTRTTWNGEKPILFYNNDCEDNYWMPVRKGVSYRLERSENGGAWQTIANITNPANYSLENGLIKYTDNSITSTSTYRYRVIAKLSDGTEVTGDPGNVMTKYIPTEYLLDANGNYDGGFERGDAMFSGSKATFNSNGKSSNGWCKASGVAIGKATNEVVSGKTAYEGNYYLHINSTKGYGTSSAWGAQCLYYISVPGDKKYCVSEWNRDSYQTVSLSVHDAETNETLAYVGNRTSNKNNSDKNVWYRSYAYFDAPEHGKIYLKLMNPGSGNSDQIIVDSISVTEAR